MMKDLTILLLLASTVVQSLKSEHDPERLAKFYKELDALGDLEHVSLELANFYNHFESIVELKGGEFRMGINDRYGVNGEYPQRFAKVKPFRIMQYPVTMASFQKFRYAKSFMTFAEDHGVSWCFKNLTNKQAAIDGYQQPRLKDRDSLEAKKQHMRLIINAEWSKPFGGKSGIFNYLDYPVVHVSYHDAYAYCSWKKMRLPNEMEWEFAAKGGLKNNPYPWGEQWDLNRTNLWQGTFPIENQLRDRFYGLSPVDGFKAQNNYEMYDMIGNVWEWTDTVYRPHGEDEDGVDRYVLKGGSFLDLRDGLHTQKDSEKLKIRISSRIGRGEDFAAQNIGFRCAASIGEHEIGYKFKEKETYRVHKFRAPRIIHPNIELSRNIIEKHEKKPDNDEL